MGKIIDLAAKRQGATDAEKFLLNLYELLTWTIDGMVGDPIVDKLGLIAWHTDLEMVLWPNAADEDDDESEER